MTITDTTGDGIGRSRRKANRHLWGHFARHGEGITPPIIITRGEGVRIFDDKGKSYTDGLSGLFVVQVGYGRKELAEAAKQAEQKPVPSSRCGPTPRHRPSSWPSGVAGFCTG